MGKYILKRVGYMFLTLFVVVTITFFLMRAIPGDPLATMARALPEQTRQAFYARYGLDRPLFEQYLTYMKNLLRLDLGESLRFAYRKAALYTRPKFRNRSRRAYTLRPAYRHGDRRAHGHYGCPKQK